MLPGSWVKLKIPWNMPEKDIVWHCHVQKGATKKRGWWCIEAVERKMSCLFFKRAWLFPAINLLLESLEQFLYKLNIDIMWRGWYIHFRVEVGGICPKGWHSLPQKRSFYLAQTWATQVGSTQRFLRFFCWPCSSASMDAFACVEIVDAGRKNHENMDSNHTCEQTKKQPLETNINPGFTQLPGIFRARNNALGPWF